MMKRFVYFILFYSFCCFSALASEKFVLILHSYHQGYNWTNQVQQGITEGFKVKENPVFIDYRVEYMNSYDSRSGSYYQELANLYSKKYIKKPDLIIAVDNNAVDFLKKYRNKIWGEVPIVFCGLNNFNESTLDGIDSISGIAEKTSIKETLEMVQSLQPLAKRFIFLYNSGITGQEVKKSIEDLKSLFPKIEFSFIADPSYPSLLSSLQKEGADTAVFLVGFLKDESGKLYSIPYGTQLLRSKTELYLYSFFEHFLGYGIVGGKFIRGFEHGQKASEMALKVLNGADIKNIPVDQSQIGEFWFDADELAKRKIPLSRLPPHYQLVNDQFLFVKKYERVILILGGVSVAFACIFILVFVYLLDRRRILKRLHEKNERLSSLTSNIPDMVLYRAQVSYPQHVLFVSETVQGLAGFTKGEVQELMKLVHPDDQAYVKTERERQILRGKTFELDYRILCRDQGIKYVREKGRVVENSDGLVMDGVLIDVSPIKNLEKEKSQIQNQLFQSARLASVGTLAAGVAHEINNPLAILQGYFDIIKKTLDKKGQLDGTLKDYFETGVNSLERISTIVNGLRVFAKSDLDHYGPVNIHKVIEDTAGLCRPIFKKQNIAITQKLEAPFFLVHGNEGKLQQVVMNILTNARDAIVDSERKFQGEIIISTCLGNGNFQLKIEDNGVGVPREYWQRIFDPFFTTKAPGKGIGLGLSIVHSIVELMHGRIEVASVQNKGTTICINLPLSLSISQNDFTAKIAPSSVGVRFSGKSLIIDDEGGMRRVLKSYLEGFGLEVIEAEDGLQALQFIHQTKFDYIFVDHHMPKMDGVEFLSQSLFREQNSSEATQSHYFFMTGGFAEEALAPELKKKIKGFLNKPFSEEDLIRLLKIE